MDPITIAALASAASGVMNASKPAPASLPTSKSDFFGSGIFSLDSSGWLVNFGDAATQGQTNAAKSGPSLTSTPTNANPNSMVTPANGPTGWNPPAMTLPVTGAIAGIPTAYILMAGGALLLVIILKKRRG